MTIVKKWSIILIKNIFLIFSIFISFFIFNKISSIISYTNDNNKILMVNLVITILLMFTIVLLKWDNIKNNTKVFFSILLIFLSVTIYTSYYINYKFGKSYVKSCTIDNKYIDVFPKDKTIKTYIIHIDCVNFQNITVNKKFYKNKEKGMEITVVLNEGILGFNVLKEVNGKNILSLID